MKTANRIFMGVTGLVLLFAGAMKSHHLLTEPIISKGFWESWEFFLIQIPLELGLGIWLLCGLFKKAAWLTAVLSFASFIVVTLHKGLIGAASCGCFGRVDVDPWTTLLAIDIPFFLVLLIFRPKGEKLLPPPWPLAKHFFGVAIPTFTLMAVILPVLIFNKPPEKTDTYEVIKPEEWTSQEPPVTTQPLEEQTGEEKPNEPQVSEEPIREEWPLLKHIDIADALRSGIAVVLLYHHDCPECLEGILQYDRISRELAGSEDEMLIAFIEAPPYDPEEDNPIPPGTLCLTGRLDTNKEWLFITPLVVVTVDGSVVKFWEAEVPQLDEILETVFGGD